MRRIASDVLNLTPREIRPCAQARAETCRVGARESRIRRRAPQPKRQRSRLFRTQFARKNAKNLNFRTSEGGTISLVHTKSSVTRGSGWRAQPSLVYLWPYNAREGWALNFDLLAPPASCVAPAATDVCQTSGGETPPQVHALGPNFDVWRSWAVLGRASRIHSITCGCLAAQTSSARLIARSSCFEG